MDAYATNNSDNRMGDKHIMSVGYSNGTMRMYRFDAKAREFYIVGENASVFDSGGEGGEGIRKNMACTSLIFVNPAAENEYEQFPNVLMCNRFGLLTMSDAENWIEQTKPRMNLQTDFSLTHSIADVGNGFVACCGRMKEDNVNGVSLFDAFDVQRIDILERERDDGRARFHVSFVVRGRFAEDVTVSADDDDEDDVTNRQIRITVVAAGRDARKLVAEKFSNRTNVKSIGFSLGNMKVGGKRDDVEEKNTKTSRIYAWEFII